MRYRTEGDKAVFPHEDILQHASRLRSNSLSSAIPLSIRIYLRPYLSLCPPPPLSIIGDSGTELLICPFVFKLDHNFWIMSMISDWVFIFHMCIRCECNLVTLTFWKSCRITLLPYEGISVPQTHLVSIWFRSHNWFKKTTAYHSKWQHVGIQDKAGNFPHYPGFLIIPLNQHSDRVIPRG